MKRLPFADTLDLPKDAATQTFAAIGRRGSGKTYAAGKLVEILYADGAQVAILDSVGNWFGLRLDVTGKAPGLDIPIFGGLRGDIPLEPTGGALVADALIDSGRSLVLDISQFSKADRQRFAAAFGERLWQRKKAERRPSPVHLVIEEAQLIVPEFVGKDQTHMVGVFTEIIRLGRNYGIGATLITQRPQSVSKEVLNQTECLLVFQVNGAHERKALRDWIVYQGIDARLVDELPGLQPGSCYCWSPQWLNVLRLLRVYPKTTFDSTATPKAGGVYRGKELKPIDLKQLQEKMAATIERAKADDPRELRKKIANLESQLYKSAQAAQTKVEIKETKVEVPVLKNGQLTRAEGVLQRMSEIGERLMTESANLRSAIGKATASAGKPQVAAAPAPPSAPRPQQERPAAACDARLGIATGLQTRIMIALAQYPAGLTKKRLAALAGSSLGSGSFSARLSELRKAGFAEETANGVAATAAGVAALGPFDPLPIGPALVGYWRQRTSAGLQRSIFEVLTSRYPAKLSLAELAEAAGSVPGSGSFSARLSELAKLGIIERDRSGAKAADELFET